MDAIDEGRRTAPPSSRGPLKVLAIGHSYVVAMNRAILREIAQDPNFSVIVGAPSYFTGDLRPVECEPEPSGSPLTVVPIRTRMSRWIHVFQYHARDLRRLRDEHAFDVVHAWEEPYIYAGHQVARVVGRRSVPFCFRTAQSLSKRHPPPFSHFERSVVRRAQAWIAGGELVYRAMASRGYPSERGQVITLAVDTKAFRTISDAEKRSVLAELNLQPPVIGFVGRLTQDKGLDVLMAAVETLGDQKWSLLLLGSGAMQSDVQRWAARNSWQDRVRIHLAKHAEVPPLLGAMDVMVAPSQTTPHWKEQFGRMLIEAFACGVPVVGSDSGEIPHVIQDAGLVVGEKDSAGFGDAIRKVLNDDALRAQLIERGYARADYYSAERVAERYKEFYRRLATLRVN